MVESPERTIRDVAWPGVSWSNNEFLGLLFGLKMFYILDVYTIGCLY